MTMSPIVRRRHIFRSYKAEQDQAALRSESAPRIQPPFTANTNAQRRTYRKDVFRDRLPHPHFLQSHL